MIDDGALANELVIPVYLDTNVLLDLLATVEDGLSLVERVTSGQTSGHASERSGNADFGTPSIFPFFKLGFSGKLGKTANEGASEMREAERTHTYGSLLHRLRRYLIEEHLIATLAGHEPVAVGNFIEFSGVVRPNPFTDSFKLLQRMLGFVEVGHRMSDQTAVTTSGTKGKGGHAQAQRPPANPEAAKMKAIQDFIQQLTVDVEREGTSTILVESQSTDYKAVVTLFDDYLRDRSMAELLNRDFRILGKVARHLPSGSTEAVDLLASSGVAGFPPELLGTLTKSIGTMTSSGAMQVAMPLTAIDPPVIEIVPIAIYL